ncbi:MAG: response regulator transcription factor [Faecalibacterium sp.]
MMLGKRCVLIVDDETKIVRALKDFLTLKGFAVRTAGDGVQALEEYYANNTEIDLILLDVMMPLRDGFAVLSELRQSGESVPVIMLTAKGQEYDQLRGFENGADDYVQKPFSLSLLHARIEAVLKRAGKADQPEIIKGELKLNAMERTVYENGNLVELTKREFDLLQFFLSNTARVFTREQLLNSVWGYDFFGDIRTVDTHVKQLRIKLKESGLYLKTVHRIGYKFEEPGV